MKRVAIALLAGVAAVAGLGHAASAADLAIPPPPPPPPSWTGFYVGAHAGAAWQKAADWNFNDPNGILGFADLNSAAKPALGGVGGFQAGYNWQFATAWVVGVEGDFSWTSLSDQRTVGPISGVVPFLVPLLGSATNVQMSANTEWLASARAKVGFTGWLNNTMFYATGGVAWANIEYAGQFTCASGLCGITRTSVTSFNETKTGWVAGAGAEWMATPNILLRAEYLYYAFNSGTNASALITPPLVSFPAPVNYTWGSYNVQVFRVAASYKF